MRVSSEVKPLEINGEKPIVATKSILVSSVWGSSDKVTVEIEGVSYLVKADDLRKAVENAVNS